MERNLLIFLRDNGTILCVYSFQFRDSIANSLTYPSMTRVTKRNKNYTFWIENIHFGEVSLNHLLVIIFIFPPHWSFIRGSGQRAKNKRKINYFFLVNLSYKFRNKRERKKSGKWMNEFLKKDGNKWSNRSQWMGPTKYLLCCVNKKPSKILAFFALSRLPW